MIVRPATEGDKKAVLVILNELDLYYKALVFKDFWVAEDKGEIIGVFQLAPYDKFVYLTSLGIKPEKQKQGVGRLMLQKLLPDIKQPVYLYTIIPDYFKQFGFQVAPHALSHLPSKERYECKDCFPDKCVTMVKYPDVA